LGVVDVHRESDHLLAVDTVHGFVFVIVSNVVGDI